MARTPEALVEPALLIWARRSIGLDQVAAARKIDVPIELLQRWEAGDEKPSLARLRKAAAVYKRPLAIFYLPEPPLDFQPLRDYRRLPDAELGSLSPELIGAIRRARGLREVALELREIHDEPALKVPRLGVSAPDPERFGEAARDLLGIGLENQFSWLDPRRALNRWIEALGAQDVLVLQVQSIPLGEMRGFSITADPMPVVMLNGGDFPRGRIFTVLHEWMHVLLNADGVCDTLPRRHVSRPTDEIEVFCNRAAAAALMPADAFSHEPAIKNAPPDGRWSEEVLGSLSQRYSVSKEAVVRRLYTFGLTDWGFLQAKQEEYRAAYEAYRLEQQKKRQEGKSSGPTFYRMKVRDLGRGLIESAVDAYYQRAITGSDLAEYLEIKVDQLPKLEAELALTGGSRE